jgi:hypothetical protein
MFWDCKICKEKDKHLKSVLFSLNAHIKMLEDEVKFLKELAVPKHPKSNNEVELEANALLSGHQDVIDLRTPEEIKKEPEMQESLDSEAARMLAGEHEGQF